MLHREGTEQAEKGVTGPLGTECSIRGQTEEDCLFPVCRCLAAVGHMLASESHRLIED